MQAGYAITVKIETVLKGMHVVDHESCGLATIRETREQGGIGIGGSHSALNFHSLVRADRIKRQYDRQTLNKGLQQHDENRKVRQRHVIVVHRREEEDMLSGEMVLRYKAVDCDVICFVRKFVPVYLEPTEPIRR